MTANTEEEKIRMTAHFSLETVQDRRQRSNIFKVVKEQNYQPKIYIQQECFSKTEIKIKTFSYR